MSELARILNSKPEPTKANALEGAAPELMKAVWNNIKQAPSQMGAELGRLTTQGGMEISNLLFNGQGFVPYGPGQYTPSPERQQQHNQGMER